MSTDFIVASDSSAECVPSTAPHVTPAKGKGLPTYTFLCLADLATALAEKTFIRKAFYKIPNGQKEGEFPRVYAHMLGGPAGSPLGHIAVVLQDRQLQAKEGDTY